MRGAITPTCVDSVTHIEHVSDPLVRVSLELHVYHLIDTLLGLAAPPSLLKQAVASHRACALPGMTLAILSACDKTV